MTLNRTARLKQRPKGPITRDLFEFRDEPLAEPDNGQFRVRAEYLSLDPAMRGWINAGRSYIRPVEIGEVMRGYAAGHVEVSDHPDYKVGDAVAGLFGAQTHAVSDGRGEIMKVDTALAPLPRWIGGLGMPGRTAYFGLLEVGQVKAGETVVVSAASGAVGAIVGQLALIHGARAVGIAGGPDKCTYLVDELGFDAAVDYKAGDLAAQLDAACPDGIDVYYENVGGEILDAVLPRMNRFGRIPVCGLISSYNATEPPPGPRNFRSVLVNRLKIQGLIVFDFAERYAEATSRLAEWHAAGKLKIREDVRDGGLDAFVDTLNLLFTGGNFGKLVLRL